MPYLQTRTHTRLFFVDSGGTRPIVFIASAWLNSSMWEFQMPALAALGFRCIAFDRRGHGKSDAPWSGYDYDTLADDLASLLTDLDLRDVTLVAHSAGAGEAVRYLTRHGAARVAALVLIAGTTPFPMKTPENPDGIDPAWADADVARRTQDRARWYAENADGFFGVGLPGVSVSRAFARYMMDECLSCSFRATREVFLTAFTTDLRQELRAVTVPTLVIHGDHDLQAPLDLCGRRTAALVRDSRLLVYENAAHGLFVTHAERLNADVARFVQQHTAAAGPVSAGR